MYVKNFVHEDFYKKTSEVFQTKNGRKLDFVKKTFLTKFFNFVNQNSSPFIKNKKDKKNNPLTIVDRRPKARDEKCIFSKKQITVFN